MQFYLCLDCHIAAQCGPDEMGIGIKRYDQCLHDLEQMPPIEYTGTEVEFASGMCECCNSNLAGARYLYEADEPDEVKPRTMREEYTHAQLQELGG